MIKDGVLQKAKAFDSEGIIKRSVDEGLKKLKVFRTRYPFAERTDTIELLRPEDIFITDTGKVGEFFHYIEYDLKSLGQLRTYPAVYRQISEQMEHFKRLLYTVVDQKKRLAEKVDAPWREIKGLGGDSHIAKKIIFCFNYETGLVAPIFSTAHLEYFLNTIREKPWLPEQYAGLSLGERYEALTKELLNVKEYFPETKNWEVTYFCRFLYENYTPPKIVTASQRKKLREEVSTEQRKEFARFIELLEELKKKGRITPEQWRAYVKKWNDEAESRQMLIEKLRGM